MEFVMEWHFLCTAMIRCPEMFSREDEVSTEVELPVHNTNSVRLLKQESSKLLYFNWDNAWLETRRLLSLGFLLTLHSVDEQFY
jgi:hypothetical protein